MRRITATWRISFLCAMLACAPGTYAQTAPVTAGGVPSAKPADPRNADDPVEVGTVPCDGCVLLLAADDSVSSNVSGSADRSISNVAPVSVAPIAEPKNPEAKRFQWKASFAQAFEFTLFNHAYRMAGEKGTRDATGNGKWFQDWMNSIGETRGWDDGDGWHASYVGHPFEGAIFGFIEQQNDPKYRTVEWGDGRIYWISRLRALAFSALWSTQWTVGPVSEASLGNGGLHASPGFIDLVNTPLLGVGEMMGEDMIDRYFLTKLENNVSNPWVLMLARSFGNPTRSFANLMAFKLPWMRYTRPDIFGPEEERRKELIAEYKAGLIEAPYGHHTAEERAIMNKDADNPRPRLDPYELSSYAMYETFLGGGSCMGAGGAAAGRVKPALQIVGEVNGCLVINMPKNQSGDSTMFAVGLRWTPLAGHRFSPFAEVMFGGRRITQEINDPGLKKKLLDEWNSGEITYFPKRSDYSIQYQALGFSITAGGGFDATFGRAFAWRVVDVEYARSWLPTVDQITAAHGLQIRSSLVLKIGTW